MKLTHEIDHEGYFICDAIIPEPGKRYVDTQPPQGMIRPRYVGGEWVDAGVPTPAQIESEYTAHLEVFYDSKAKERRYDNRITCALRAGYPGPFQPEGLAFALWMDDCNRHCYGVMEDVVAGERPLPSKAELIAELPMLEWPE